VQFANNGTGTFGGPYADGLVLGHSYHFNIQYTEPNGTLAGNSNSSSFIMINPVVGSASKTSSANSTAATSTSASASTQPPSTSIAAAQNSSSGLPTGAKAGIAVGVTVVGLLFLLGIFFLWRRHNRSHQTTTHSTHVADATGPSELEGKAMTQSPGYSGSYSGELSADAPVKKPQELDSNTISRIPLEKSKQKRPVSEASRSESHLMPPASGPSLSSPSDVSTGSSTFVGGQRTSEDMTPEQLAQLEEEERRIDEAIRESEAQRKAVEARIKQARGGAGSSS
jgi:hypothetical protein